MKRFVSVFLCAILLVSLAGCKKSVEIPVSNPEEFKIFTSFYPIYVTTLNLIDGAQDVSLVNLTNPDIGCMHEYMLTPEELKRMSGADLFIASGMGMEAFVEKSSLGIPRLEILDCGEDIKNKIGDKNNENSHYWMNIENTIEQCEKIKRTLCRLDPKNSAVYEKNAKAYTDKLRALILEISPRCEKLKYKAIVVYHDSFDYFAKEFGLNTTTLADEEGAEKYAADVKQLGYIFVQKSYADTEAYKKYAEKTECETYIINTVTGGVVDETAKDAYINAIRQNIDLFEKVLG